MWGFFEAVQGFLQYALGMRTDTANPTGSGLARLADIENKLGTVSPTSGGMDTLFHALWQLNNYLNGGATIPGLGQQGDAGNAAGSANAKLADIRSYLASTIYAYLTGTIQPEIVDLQSNRVGAQGDAASATGSVSAKLKALLARVGAQAASYFYAVNNTTSPVTVCNISGTGILKALAFLTGSANITPYITVVADGTTLLNAVQITATGDSFTTVITLPIDIQYSSSLTVSFTSTVNTSYSLVAAIVKEGVV